MILFLNRQSLILIFRQIELEILGQNTWVMLWKTTKWLIILNLFIFIYLHDSTYRRLLNWCYILMMKKRIKSVIPICSITMKLRRSYAVAAIGLWPVIAEKYGATARSYDKKVVFTRIYDKKFAFTPKYVATFIVSYHSLPPVRYTAIK